MSTIALTCPLDALVLAADVVVTERGEPTKAHVHLTLNGVTYTCLNGHRWRVASGDIILERA